MSKVSTKMVEAYLKRYGWDRFQTKTETGEKEGVVITGWGSLGGDKHILVIDPIEEKKVLTFHVQVLNAPLDRTPDEHLRELLVALGQINFQIILGKFGYDPRDGEVRFSIAVPTDNNTVTYEQFKHCLDIIVRTIELYHTPLSDIAKGRKTHRDIGMGNELSDILRRLLQDSRGE